MFSVVVMMVLLILLLLIFGTLAYASLVAAPWVPLFQRDIRRLIKLAQIKPGELVYDLGCGDGRVLIATVKLTGARTVGFEIAVLPWLLAKLRVRLAGLQQQIQIRFQNFFNINLGSADVVICFLTPHAMTKLEPKVHNELKPGARFLSYAFPLPNTKPRATEKDDPRHARIFLY